MSAGSWLLWLLSAAAAIVLSIWHYRQRETPGRGRLLLALLRGCTLALVLLLIFDPELPSGDSGAVRGSHVLLDASLSMALPGTGEGSRWQEATGTARARAGDRPILLFGSSARPVTAVALPDSTPGDTRSELLPALQAAAEAGARRVTVITDGGIEDADIVARWQARLGLEVETVLVGSGADAANRAVVEVSAPQWAEAGQPVTVEFAVAGTAADSIGVAVRLDGRVLGRTAVPAPAAGRLATGTVEIRLDAPPGGGWVRLEVALEGTDAIPDDDARTLYVQVGAEPAGVVLISFRPDWEPRFLAPVLTTALGLPLRGWLRGATGQYQRLGAGLEAGAPATEADVRRSLERAQLVVLHGLGQDAPQWAHDAARTARHLLVFPGEGAAELPTPIGSEITGDFFPSAELPPSPLAPMLDPLDVAGVAPLPAVRQAETVPGTWAPLLATRGRSGSQVPLLIGGQAGGRRWVVALGSGFWTWAFRGGSDRQLYTRLWSAVGAWLAQERGTAALAAVRPADMAVPRGTPIPWLAQGLAADSIRIQLSGADGAQMDTVIRRTGGDSLFSSAPAPGHYSYRATAFGGDNVLTAEGLLTVEHFSPELSRPAVDLAALRAPASTVRSDDGRTRGRPLHATAYPWILMVGLLAAEWILRRRWGLR